MNATTSKTLARLQAKVKAQGKKTAEEKNREELLASKKGQALVMDMLAEKVRIDRLLKDYPNYKLDYLSLLLCDQNPEKMTEYGKLISAQDPENKTLLMITQLIATSRKDNPKRQGVMRSGGVWVLRHEGVPVCFATMLMFQQLNYITTVREHRGKGHATTLLTLLGRWYEEVSGFVFGAVNPEVLPLFARAGWHKPNEEANNDGTYDVCPAYAKGKYLQSYENGQSYYTSHPKKMEMMGEKMPMLSALAGELMV